METELKEKLLKIKQNDTTWQCTLRRAPIWITLEDIFGNLGLSKNHVREQLQSKLERYTQFTLVMRFVLDNHETRDFHAERWRYGGMDEGWIFAGHSGKIDHLAEKLIPYLGTDNFYTLY